MAHRAGHDKGMDMSDKNYIADAALSVCADGGKGDAVYQVRPRNGEEWTDVCEAEYKICGGAGYVQRILYTAPQADGGKDSCHHDPSWQEGYKEGYDDSRLVALDEAAKVAYAHSAIMATTTAQLIEKAIRALSVRTPKRDAERFEWPALPALPEPMLHPGVVGHSLFSEHQMQGYANAYGEAVRAASSVMPNGGKDSMDTLVAMLNAICYTEEFAEAHPNLKVSEGVKLFLQQRADGGKGEAVAWRYFDGEGNYEYRDEPPSESSVYHAAIYGRKFEPLYLAAPQAECAPRADAEKDAIRALVALHAQQLENNPYAYFELAYTRYTGWMAWLCSNSRDDDPNRKVIAKGQGDTPEAACAAAILAANKEPQP
jgi:hypothetical protein